MKLSGYEAILELASKLLPKDLPQIRMGILIDDREVIYQPNRKMEWNGWDL